MLLQVRLRPRAALVGCPTARRAASSCAGRGLALQDLRDDWLAHRLRSGPKGVDQGHDVRAEPLDLESDFDFTGGRRRSPDGPTGFRRRDVEGLPRATRLAHP